MTDTDPALRTLRQRVVEAMPWYDESDPDYTELDAVLSEAQQLDKGALATAIRMVEATRSMTEGYVYEGPSPSWFEGYAEDIATQYELVVKDGAHA